MRVYACGPTVYGRIHVGNARPIVVFDVLVRLCLRHAKVTYVRNITDVDDKINMRAANAVFRLMIYVQKPSRHFIMIQGG